MAPGLNASGATNAEGAGEALLAQAVREIEKSPALRAFVREFLTACGCLPQQSVFDPDPVQNAFDQGRQAAGLVFLSQLTARAPLLWPALQIEEMTDAQEVE